MRIRLPPTNEERCGRPEQWFAWRPVVADHQLVWLIWVSRTRWHSPMGHWYWAYSLGLRAEPTHEELRSALQECWGALNFILAFYEPGQRYLDTEAWKQAEASGRRARAQAAILLGLRAPDKENDR